MYIEKPLRKNNIKVVTRKVFDNTILDITLFNTTVSLRVSEAVELIEKIQEKI